MSDQEIDEEKLTAVYKYILHEKVPEDDNYTKAMKLLKLGYVEQLASRNSKEGAVLVARTIQQYRDIVDKEDYYASCREKYKHIKLPDLSKRPEPSKLLTTDVKEFIGEPLPCAGKYEYCKELEVTDEDLKSFCINPPKDDIDIDFDFDELESSLELCINDIQSQKKSTVTSEKESTVTSEKESKATSSSLLNEFPKPTFSKQVSVNKDLPFNFNRSPQPCSSKSIDQNMDDSEDSSKKSTLKQSNLNSMFFKPQINRTQNSTVSSVSKEIPIVKKRKLSPSPPPPTTAPKSNLYPDFKSSLEELHLQNAKQNKNPAQQSSSYLPNPAAVMRKSVGLSKPFKVPLEAQQTTSNAPEPEQTNSPTDERLKNIDPKFVEMIQNEIIYSGKKVLWDDIAGLSYAKQIIKEAIILPLLRPDIFTGLRRAPKGILLYGPPGTGKTLIGKCIASQSKSTFFSISASALTSKWIGEGEKLVRALFAVARVHQPAVVFIDEIDSLLSQRSETEHESSRRLKTEFLVQLDGAATCEDDMVIVVAATNRPQELDEAARRRFTKRLYIPLPENEDRIVLLSNVLRNESVNLSIRDVEEISTLTDGFSGADLKNLCAEASMVSFREMTFAQITSVDKDDIRKTDLTDFKSALKRVRATVSPGDLTQYIKWNETFGSGKAST